MSDIVIQVVNLSKRYRLGVIGSGTLSHDLNRWWARVRGKPDPLAKVGESQKTESRKQKAENGRSSQLSAFPISALNAADDPDYMWALKDVSFEVRRGEVLGIIGRNGAGKSTLLKILSRVTAPTNGEVRVKGRMASLLEVGTGFHPELTGRENIFLNGAILGMKKAEIAREFDEIVDFSGVEQFIDTPVKRYSSGMYVRLAFAVAAHLEPEILVVDEVLAVGDAEFQSKCLGKMDTLATGGRTVLFVSHNMPAIRSLCNRSVILSHGRLLWQGAAGEGVGRYLSEINCARTVDLSDASGRPGSGGCRLTSVYICDGHRHVTKDIVCGKTMNLVFEYRVVARIDNPCLRFSVYDMGGRIMFHATTSVFGLDRTMFANSHTLVCTISETPLPAGDYRINVSMEDNSKICDHVEGAMVFRVLEGDFFGTGRTVDTCRVGVLVKHSWSFGASQVTSRRIGKTE